MQATTTQAVATSTVATVKPTEQKSGPKVATTATEGDPRTFGQEVLPKQTTTSAPTPTTPTKPQEQVNTDTRASLVNILCLVNSSGILRGISGSGVVVDNRGVILTNAHIGQYFLLKDYLTPDNVQCVVRIGSPAEASYTATLLYLPPVWITDNATQLVAQQASGTGEHDFAFLLITGTTNPNGTLPTSFPAVAMDLGQPDIGNSMLLAAYPAGFLSPELIQKSLYQTSAIAYVTQLFSFDTDTTKVDLFSVGGTVVSQAGSSGGAVVRIKDGTLAGVISTDTTANTTGERDLRAITLSHINSTLAKNGQGGIAALLTGDLSAKAATFESTTAASERATLYSILNNR